MAQLLFEISTTAPKRFFSVFEAAVAALMRDFGYGANEGKLLAAKLCHGVSGDRSL